MAYINIYRERIITQPYTNETLPFMTTKTNLEGIRLTELSQTENNKCCMISPICRI